MASARNTESLTQLTEFGALESDRGGGLFSRIFSRKSAEPVQTKAATDGVSIATEVLPKVSVSASSSRVTDVKQPIEAEKHSTGSERESSDGGLDTDSVTDSVHSGSQAPPTRNAASVLHRLYNILDRRSQTPQAYRDSDFKQYWMPDNNCKECYGCGEKFNTFRRRHHCRICGLIFCSSCCNQEVPGKLMGYRGSLRACTYCCGIVLGYVYDQNPEWSGDLQMLSEDLRRHLQQQQQPESDSDGRSATASSNDGEASERAAAKPRRSSRMSRVSTNDLSSVGQRQAPFDLTPQSEYPTSRIIEEERKLLLKDSVELRELWMAIQHPTEGVLTQSHRHRLRTYNNCFLATDIIQWLLDRDRADSREQAVALGQALVDAKWLDCISRVDQVFNGDYALYHPGEAALKEQVLKVVSVSDVQTDDEGPAVPDWFRQIEQVEDDTESSGSGLANISSSALALASPVSSSVLIYSEENDSLENSERRDSTNKAISHERGTMLFVESLGAEFNGILDKNDKQSSDSDTSQTLVRDQLSKSQKEHLILLTNQLLAREGLSSKKWADLLLSLAKRVTHVVRPDVKNDGDDMDIRKYVQIKKLAGGSLQQTTIVHGVVCTKTVAHRKMQQHIHEPRILLLRSPLEYQRVENKFSSLEPQILQERDFLKNSVARIASMRPDLLLVEKTVSRLAQEYLLDANITLVANVKPSVLQRVARFTQADIVPSMDSLAGKSALGVCHSFKVQTCILSEDVQKSLMYFDGCAQHLGCTVILRGGNVDELVRVKKVFHFVLYATSHLRMELAYLTDEQASIASLSQGDGFLTANETPAADDKSGGGSVDAASKQQGQGRQLLTASSDVAASATKQDDQANFSFLVGDDHTVAATAPAGGKATDSSESVDANKPPPIGGLSSRNSGLSFFLDATSDPLQQAREHTTSESAAISSEVADVEENSSDRRNRLRKAIADITLSITPFTHYNLPYLETAEGSACQMRVYFPRDMYQSPSLDRVDSGGKSRHASTRDVTNGTFGNYHRLLFTRQHSLFHCNIVDRASATPMKALISDFRSRGGRLPFKKLSSMDGSSSQNGTQDKGFVSNRIADEFQMDFLDPYRHQRLSLLFVIFCVEPVLASSACLPPWVVTMEYYGNNDITLGAFLERYCFSANYHCPSKTCEAPMSAHLRRFVHDSACVSLLLRRLKNSIPSPERGILMWSWCRKCEQHTPLVPISSETWSMSFGKFLELRFYGGGFGHLGEPAGCHHLLHRDFDQYFGFQQTVAAFKHSTLTLREIVLPPEEVSVADPDLACDKLEGVVAHVQHGCNSSVYSTALDIVRKLRVEAISDWLATLLDESLAELQHEKELFSDTIMKLHALLHDLDEWSSGDNAAFLEAPTRRKMLTFKIQDLVVLAKRRTADALFKWNNRLKEVEPKKAEKSSKAIPVMANVIPAKSSRETVKDSNINAAVVSPPDSVAQATVSDSPVITMATWLEASLRSQASSEAGGVTDGPISIATVPCNCVSATLTTPPVTSEASSVASSTSPPPTTGKDVSATAVSEAERGSVSCDSATVVLMDSGPSADVTATSTLPSGVNTTADPLEPVASKTTTDVTTANADSSQGEGAKFSPTATAKAVHARNASCGEVDTLVRPTVTTAVAGPRSSALADDVAVFSLKPPAVTSVRRSGSFSDTVGRPSSRHGEPIESEKRGSVKNFVTSLLPSASTLQISSPFPDDEHYLLMCASITGKAEKIPIIVYDQEPSSIIAFTLSSPDYEDALQKLRIEQTASDLLTSSNPSSNLATKPSSASLASVGSEATDGSKKTNVVLSFLMGSGKESKQPSATLTASHGAGVTGSSVESSVRYTPNTNRNSMEDEPDFSIVASATEADKSAEILQRQLCANQHIELEFSESGGKFHIYCKVYFAEQFRKLRKLVFKEGEERFIRSLSRCFTWLAKGGKSGSAFCKTQDDRFIMKQMSRYEVQSFPDFAPHYFNYLSAAFTEKKPTALAKILGVYRIGYRNTLTNTASKQDVLVMENLFYGRTISQVFDLKGSVRGRMVNESEKGVKELVLLDENLLRLSLQSPLYIRPHSKAVLMRAITSDTSFLSSLLVMDYSLLVGIDEDNRKLVIGIIDYIRTFTWDKKLEMVVKSTYNQIGGQGKMPTIVSPEVYRLRFLDAMNRYFLMVPDQWTGLETNFTATTADDTL